MSPHPQQALAHAIRFLSIDAIVRAQEGHQGVPLGMAEIATALYTRHLKFNPQDAGWFDRDRVVLSNGHGSMLLYSLLNLTGYPAFPIEEIQRFRVLGSVCEGHPERPHGAPNGIEVITGPLGQGIANAFGMAVAEAYLNARFGDEAGVVTRYGAVHLGMAAQTDAGLMVPVIRDAQGLNLWQLAREIGRLAEAARTGKATSEELSGSTLTITSLGPLGGVATTPVINRPEVAIIGPNRIVERPMFVPDGMGGERIAKRKLMNLSISCDHRVVDGWDAASFVQAVKRLIETPVLLLAD